LSLRSDGRAARVATPLPRLFEVAARVVGLATRVAVRLHPAFRAHATHASVPARADRLVTRALAEAAAVREAAPAASVSTGPTADFGARRMIPAGIGLRRSGGASPDRLDRRRWIFGGPSQVLNNNVT